MQAISRAARSFLPIVLSIAALAAAPLWVASAGTSASSPLLLRVEEGAALDVRGADVIVKVRLDRGVTAQIWSAPTCNLPTAHSTSISANGTYTFPVASLSGGGEVMVCLATSDQKLRVQASLR